MKRDDQQTQIFCSYLDQVMVQIKSKDAHQMIVKELEGHLKELSTSYQQGESISKEDADQKAIAEMGNPVALGKQLNKVHRPKMDWGLLGLFTLIVAVSFLPLFGMSERWNLSFFLRNKILWYAIALIVLTAFLFFDYRKLLKYGWYIYAGGAILVVLMGTYSLQQANGTIFEFHLRFIQFDLLLTLLLFYIGWASILIRVNRINTISWQKQILLFGLFWFPIIGYHLHGQTMLSLIYFITILMMVAFSEMDKGLTKRFILTNILFGIAAVGLMLGFGGYHTQQRILTFFNQNSDPDGYGFIYTIFKDMFLEAGWFGNGLTVDMGILPEAHTDYVFPNLVYSLGWLAGIAICILLLSFILRIVSGAFKTHDLYGRILVIGGASLFTVAIVWNILMVFGFLPIMAVSLPFISYGGSQTIFYSAVLGLILNIYRRKDIVEPTIVRHADRIK
ncbi:FtsW/RodA/SpoVE family cell cycle protein [Evansella tamaricis]|uniref:FtsW/RodA/SpoVE family cell cycle protein n=1 Tax=Evansella tamaricis TaxID=2069301 RepID=A0ABS6JGM1_9BACI|nr:FtsW/RodA/SpoVE family cell cycle protein [Evansella tamaricis]MBU9712814.1 FtsW/RodA/SpoVE family cell cycle protein [Evansella tamaricis]